MRDSLSESHEFGRNRFQRVVETFLNQPGLPFAQVLSAERIERVFQRHGNLFGLKAVYSTAIMAWSFLSQVLRDGKEASCQAAVARIVVHQQQCGGPVPTSDTGDYCRARAKLSEAALHDLAVEVAGEMQQQAPEAWRWKGRHAKLVDGFTFTMPDTPANQAQYPQATTQKPGVGFPIARSLRNLVAGHRLHHGLGARALRGQRDRRNSAVAGTAGSSGSRRGAGGRPLLLLLPDDRPTAGARGGRVRAAAPAASLRLRAPTAGWSAASGWGKTTT